MFSRAVRPPWAWRLATAAARVGIERRRVAVDHLPQVGADLIEIAPGMGFSFDRVRIHGFELDQRLAFDQVVAGLAPAMQ